MPTFQNRIKGFHWWPSKSVGGLLSDGESGYNSTGGATGTGAFFGRVNGVEKDFITTPGMLLGVRTVRGTVNSAGGVDGGTGFTSTKTGTGRYTITITSPFVSFPEINATCLQGLIASIDNGKTWNGATFGIRIDDNAGTATDSSFSFSAVAMTSEAQGQGVGVLPAGRIAASSGTHTSTGNWQKVPLNVSRLDNNLMVDTANNRLICRVAGEYNLVGQAVFTPSAAGADRVVGIAVTPIGGSRYLVGDNNGAVSASVWGRCTVSGGVVALNVGDVVELWAYQNTGGNLAYLYTETITGGAAGDITWLSAQKVGQAWVLDKTTFRAYRNAAVSLATNGLLIYDVDNSGAIAWDPNGWYDTTTGKFQPTVPGEYEVIARAGSATILTADNYVGMRIWKNPTNTAGILSAGSGTVVADPGVTAQRGVAFTPQSAPAISKCRMNGTTDFLQVSLSHNQGGTIAVQTSEPYCFFEAKFLGPG